MPSSTPLSKLLGRCPVAERRVDPRSLSQRELDDYIDRLISEGREETPEFERAYEVWEENE